MFIVEEGRGWKLGVSKRQQIVDEELQLRLGQREASHQSLVRQFSVGNCLQWPRNSSKKNTRKCAESSFSESVHSLSAWSWVSHRLKLIGKNTTTTYRLSLSSAVPPCPHFPQKSLSLPSRSDLPNSFTIPQQLIFEPSIFPGFTNIFQDGELEISFQAATPS